jgi:hypothetical protein
MMPWYYRTGQLLDVRSVKKGSVRLVGNPETFVRPALGCYRVGMERPPPPNDDGVDVTLIRWMLSLTPDERLDVLQGFVDSVAELRDEQEASQVP